MNRNTIGSFASLRFNLWKDFYQSKSVFLAVAIGVLVIQLIIVFAVLVSQQSVDWNTIIVWTMAAAGVGGLLVAIGSAAMMIGHERQTNTWAWASSLPASWVQTLLSKFLVSTTASALVALILCSVPCIIYMITPNSFAVPVDYPAELLILWASVFCQVSSMFFLCTLLFKDAMNGMAAAAIGAIIVQFGCGTAFIDKGFGQAWAYHLLVTLLTLICTVCVYRWRWRLGQNATLALIPQAVSVSIPAKTYYLGAKPSEWTTHLSLSLSNYWLIRLFATAFALVSIVFYYINPELGDASSSIAFNLCVVSLILGVTAFLGDQTNGRFRFLADRGVSPSKLFTSRLLVPFFIVLVLVIFGLVIALDQPARHRDPSWQVVLVYVIGCSSFFLLGAFSSICFRQPVIACFSAFALTIAVAVLFGNACYAHQAGHDLSWIGWNAIGWASLAPIVLLWAIYRSGRKWIVQENANLFWNFALTCGACIVVPFFLSATLSFMWIRSDPVSLMMVEDSFNDVQVLPPLEPVAEAFRIDLEKQPDESEGEFKKRLLEQAEMIEDARVAFSEPMETGSLQPKDVVIMNRLILDSARLAQALSRIGAMRESKEAWELCFLFQRQCGPRLAWLTVPSLRQVRGIVENLSDREVQFLYDTIPPSRFDLDPKLIYETRWIRAKENIGRLRGEENESPTQIGTITSRPVLSHYPPIRWRLEREALTR